MSQPEKTGTGRRILKALGIVLGCMLALVLVATILVLTLLEPYAERYLKKQVTERTNGRYQLVFEDLTIDLFTATVTLHDLHFYPDTSTIRQQRAAGKSISTLYAVEAPLLKMAQIGILDAIFNKQLDIGLLKIESPAITVMQDKEAETDSAKEKNSDSSNNIASRLKSLHIGEISIPDASYRHLLMSDTMPLHMVPRLNFRVQDLEADLTKQQLELKDFTADDVLVEVKNYRYQSPDSVYDLSLGLFAYSTKQEELVLENVVLNAEYRTIAEGDLNKARLPLYKLELPRLLVTNLDAIKAYETKKLLVDRILLENPFLSILAAPDPTADTASLKLPELYQKMAPYLKLIEAEALVVDGGSLVYNTLLEEPTTVHELQKLKVELQNVRIDSATFHSPGEQFFADEIFIASGPYTYTPPQQPLSIKIAGSEFSTRKNHLLIDSLHIENSSRKNSQALAYDLKVSGISLEEADFIEALKTSSLEAGSLTIINPALQLNGRVQSTSSSNENWLKDTYSTISDVINKLAIKAIAVEDASFTQYIHMGRSVRTQHLQNAYLKGTGLYIDSSIAYSGIKVPLEDLVIRARNYTFNVPGDPHTVALGSLRYSTFSEILTARSIDIISSAAANERLKPSGNARQNLYDLSARLFKVTGLDLLKAVNTGKLNVDEVIIREPDLAVLQDRDVAVSPSGRAEGKSAETSQIPIDSILANAIRLEDGTFTLRIKRGNRIRTHSLENASATVTELQLNPNRFIGLAEAAPFQELVLTASDYVYLTPRGVHTVTLDSLSYSSRKQQLVAKFFAVNADKERHELTKRLDSLETSRILFDVSARKFNVTGLDLIRAYETGEFFISEVLLSEPEVAVLLDKNVPNENAKSQQQSTSTNTENSEALTQIADIVETFRVDKLRVEDGFLKLNIQDDSIRTKQVLEQVSIDIDQLRLISLESTDPLEMFEADNIQVLLKDYTYNFPDSLHRLEISSLGMSLKDQTISLDSVRMVPLYEKDVFVTKIEYEDNRMDIEIPNIIVRGVDFFTLFNHQEIVVEKLIVIDPVIEIYRDKRVDDNPKRQVKTLQDQLLGSGVYINIDTIDIESARFTYLEVAPNGIEPGILLLENTQLELYNVTNDSVLIKQNNITRARGVTQFMGAGTLKVDFEFFLDHPDDLHTYTGTLEPMDFKEFNPLVVHLISAKIESGMINGVEFAVEATEHKAVGQMRFLYEDLDVQLVNPQEPGKPGFLLNAGSWLLNTLVIKSNNPSKLFDNLRIGEIDEERDKQKSIFNLMSKAMVDGISSSLMPSVVETILATFLDVP